jgi:hypothetical protein
VYSLEDALDLLEIVLVADDNQRKALESAAEESRKRKGRR